MKMKVATTTNMKEKVVTTYIHKMVVLASKSFQMVVVAKTNWCELFNVVIKLWHPMAKVFHKVDYYGLNLHQQSGSYHITSYQLPLILATSFFFNKSCMVTYFFMFLVYLPIGKAIVNYSWIQSFNFIKIGFLCQDFSDWDSRSNSPWVGLPTSWVCSWWYQIIFATSKYLYKCFT